MQLILQLNYSPHLWEKLSIDSFFDDPVFAFISEMIEEGQKQGTFSQKSSHAKSLILGFISIGMNFSGPYLQEEEIDVGDILQIIEKMLL